MKIKTPVEAHVDARNMETPMLRDANGCHLNIEQLNQVARIVNAYPALVEVVKKVARIDAEKWTDFYSLSQEAIAALKAAGEKP